MTTTISKHDVQLQQQQQQQQPDQFLNLEKQQQQQYEYYRQQQQQQQQQQQRSVISFKTTSAAAATTTNNTNLLNNSAQNIYGNATTSVDSATIATATTTTTIIQIDSLNNNNNNNTNTSLSTTTATATAALITATTATVATTTSNLINISTISPSAVNVLSINNNNNGSTMPSPDSYDTSPVVQQKSQKRRSLLNFRSLDFHIKSLYSGLRNGNKNNQSRSSSIGGGGDGGVGGGVGCGNIDGSGIIIAIDTPTGRGGVSAATINNRMPPYLKIEAVDAEESENLLLDYPQSPYSSRRNSSHDDNRSSSQLLHINRYEMSRSQATSPSPYYLSPYAMGSSSNIRRCSTSDIMSCKRSGTSSASDSRRPSTSDLLRRARERRGSEARMGRSVSHSGLPRGAFRSSCGSGSGPGGGGRRTSMAF